LPIFDLLTQTEQVEQMLFQERLMTRLSSFFGLLALVLACIGLYGLLAYDVARSTREIGIRLALGAQRRDVVGFVVGQGIWLALLGAATGVAVALGVTRFMDSTFFGVSPTDPVTFVAIPALLAVVAALASYIPARRAMRVDPMVALRHE
jgi:ABC-type antimicrobial peptide transport system permease subunit